MTFIDLQSIWIVMQDVQKIYSWWKSELQSSSKEMQLFWTHFSQWPWVTGPDPGSCTFCQMVLRVFAHCYQEHWQNKINYKVHLSTLFPKRNATFHAVFLLKKSVTMTKTRGQLLYCKWVLYLLGSMCLHCMYFLSNFFNVPNDFSWKYILVWKDKYTSCKLIQPNPD